MKSILKKSLAPLLEIIALGSLFCVFYFNGVNVKIHKPEFHLNIEITPLKYLIK